MTTTEQTVGGRCVGRVSGVYDAELDVFPCLFLQCIFAIIHRRWQWWMHRFVNDMVGCNRGYAIQSYERELSWNVQKRRDVRR